MNTAASGRGGAGVGRSLTPSSWVPAFAGMTWGYEPPSVRPPPLPSRPTLLYPPPTGGPAGVAELVDALDLESSIERCGGSSPSARTPERKRGWCRQDTPPSRHPNRRK
ncbi:MAG: hypothetical protein QOH04_2839 [Sphingomonadales bacterium]|nr:hypothetical protein [Sphingomonadales bacterium]